jgi:glycosyltransferase involved in cell wall biosynthesis
MIIPRKKKVLFVSHKANRSGAPVLLLEIIRAFSLQADIPFQVLCMEEGELIPSFNKLGKTFVWQKKLFTNAPAALALPAAIINRLLQGLRGISIMFKIRKSTLVFYNTIVNGHLQNKLSFLSARSICYVHELESAIHSLTNKEGRQYVFRYTDLFLTVSKAVTNNLINNYLVNKACIKEVHSAPKEVHRSKQQYADYIGKFKHALPSGDTVIIGVVAGNEWRKGFDFFVPLAILYFRLFPDADTCFVWKGFREGYYTSYFDRYDYEKIWCKERILLLPYGSDSIEQMACYDIHLLLSREDPYPLVVLEAASLGIPTVCFDNAGGAPEFVEEDCGYSVPYADLYQMACSLHELATNRILRYEMGNRCRSKLQTRHNKQESLRNITDIIISNASLQKA